jgi:imidazolonepropionase-like amidohydrolase
MKKSKYFILPIFFITLFLTSCSTQTEKLEGDNLLVLKGANLIDGTGTAIQPETEIILKDDKILRIGSVGDFSYPDTAQILDLKDRFILPGFINVHFHTVRTAIDEALKTSLAFGVTTIRDPGALAGLEFNINLKKKLSSGEIIGPRLLTAGPIINGPSIYDSINGIFPFETEEEIRQEVRNQIDQGADFIKVFIHLPPDLIAAAIDEAHSHNKKVIGHLGVTSWTQAAKMGIDTLCHLHFIGPVWELTPESRISEFNELYYPSPYNDLYISKFHEWRELVDLKGPQMEGLISALKENKVFVTPTFVAVEVQVWGDNQDTRDIYEPEFAPKVRADRWRKQEKHPNTANWTAEYFEEFRAAWPMAAEIIRILHNRGIPLSTGTDHILDWIPPGAAFHRELELMVKAGIPELDVLTIATRNGADNLGILDMTGTIEEGKSADLVILTKNPVLDINNTRSIETVIKQGQVFRPEELLKR